MENRMTDEEHIAACAAAGAAYDARVVAEPDANRRRELAREEAERWERLSYEAALASPIRSRALFQPRRMDRLLPGLRARKCTDEGPCWPRRPHRKQARKEARKEGRISFHVQLYRPVRVPARVRPLRTAAGPWRFSSSHQLALVPAVRRLHPCRGHVGLRPRTYRVLAPGIRFALVEPRPPGPWGPSSSAHAVGPIELSRPIELSTCRAGLVDPIAQAGDPMRCRVTIRFTSSRGTRFVETINATHRPDMFAYVMADDCPWLSRLTIRDGHGLVSKYHDRHASGVSLITYRDLT